MNSLKYKGFIGSVSFIEDDGVFRGKIEGIDGLVTFEGSSIKELTDEFHMQWRAILPFARSMVYQPKRVIPAR